VLETLRVSICQMGLLMMRLRYGPASRHAPPL